MGTRKMHYKGYTGSVEFSDVDKVYYGKVLYVKDLISYEGKNIKELKKDFKHAVDIYLEVSEIEKMTDVLSSYAEEVKDE